MIESDGMISFYKFPQRITIELSAACNLACTICPRNHINIKNGFMEMPLFQKIIAEIKHHTITAIVPFFRGESLLHPFFKEMMTIIRHATNSNIQFATNCLMLDKSMSQFLLELPIDFISFSLDAISKKTYDKIRKGGNFQLAVDNINQFISLKKSLSNSHTIVQISATKTKYNQNELSDFEKFWSKKVDRIRIYPQHSEKGIFGKLNKSSQNYQRKNRHPCRKPFSDFVIYYDGHIALCNHDWNRSKDHLIGNINNTSIEDIWSNDAYQEIRDLHMSKKWDNLQPCNQCDHWASVYEKQTMIGKLIQ